MSLITAYDLRKRFITGDVEVYALAGVDIAIESGEFITITGRSGAGKSTLLYQLSLLDEPSSGSVAVHGQDTAIMTHQARTAIRLRTFGYVFQEYALIPELTAFENVLLPALMLGKTTCEAYARSLLERVGLSDRMDHRPAELSGGQQQRVAIARALINSPEVVFADEPTANLDSETAEQVMALLQELNRDGQTLVLVTHDTRVHTEGARMIEMHDGCIVVDTGGALSPGIASGA